HQSLNHTALVKNCQHTTLDQKKQKTPQTSRWKREIGRDKWVETTPKPVDRKKQNTTNQNRNRPSVPKPSTPLRKSPSSTTGTTIKQDQNRHHQVQTTEGHNFSSQQSKKYKPPKRQLKREKMELRPNHRSQRC
ncbi:Hypothetical predicted protein, partial [Olea europaea subsp. europaea]